MKKILALETKEHGVILFSRKNDAYIYIENKKYVQSYLETINVDTKIQGGNEKFFSVNVKNIIDSISQKRLDNIALIKAEHYENAQLLFEVDENTKAVEINEDCYYAKAPSDIKIKIIDLITK